MYIFINTTDLQLTAMVTVQGHVVINEKISADTLCVNQNTLLELIVLIPVLAPFAPIIKKIIDLDHFIPASIFSVCLVLTNVNVTSSDFSACAQLNSTLMCFKDKCLYSGVDHFGCFNIPL